MVYTCRHKLKSDDLQCGAYRVAERGLSHPEFADRAFFFELLKGSVAIGYIDVVVHPCMEVGVGFARKQHKRVEYVDVEVFAEEHEHCLDEPVFVAEMG